MTCEQTTDQSATTRYLLVDDHEAFRHLLASFLPERDSEVTEASDGRAALEIYQKVRPAWILMDVEMPVLDGISATRELVSRHPEARVIILTQYESPEVERAALDSGAIGFLPKADLPLLPDLLQKLEDGETRPPHQS